MLSVVIPTLNEAAALPATLAHARSVATATRLPPRKSASNAPTACGEIEFVVADCGSSDGTACLARQAGARVIEGATCRATALNRGASIARGDVLLFLHADSKLPSAFDTLIHRALAHPGVVGGAFDFNWASHPKSRGVSRELLRMVRLINRIRFRWTGNFYGDQGLFVRRAVFDALGGFPEVKLMEDIQFARRLKRAGKTAILSPAIKTSPRRFLVRGVVRQFALDLRLLGLDACGLHCPAAWNAYNRLNRLNHKPESVTGKGPNTGTDSTTSPQPDDRSAVMNSDAALSTR